MYHVPVIDFRCFLRFNIGVIGIIGIIGIARTRGGDWRLEIGIEIGVVGLWGMVVCSFLGFVCASLRLRQGIAGRAI